MDTSLTTNASSESDSLDLSNISGDGAQGDSRSVEYDDDDFNSSLDLSIGGDKPAQVNFSFENSRDGSTSHYEHKRLEIYLEKVLTYVFDREIGDEPVSLGPAGSYDLRELLLVGHELAKEFGLPSSIFQLHKDVWTFKTLGKIVNEVEDGNGATTLCQRFLLSMHAASSNDDMAAFVAILHALVSWLYLNYHEDQGIDSDEDY